MKKQKLITLILATLLLCLAITGCGGKKSAGGYYAYYKSGKLFSILEISGSSFTYTITGKGFEQEYSGSVKSADKDDTFNLYITKDNEVYPWAKYNPLIVTIIDDDHILLDSDESGWTADTFDKISKQDYKDLMEKEEKYRSAPAEAAVDAEVPITGDASVKTADVEEVPATGDAPVSNEIPVACDSITVEKSPSEQVLADMTVTTTEFMVNDNIASNPNYVAASDLNFDSIPDNYEWLIQNHPNIDWEIDVDNDPQSRDCAQEIYNNQKIIFAGCNKIAAENGFGNITEVHYFIGDTMARVTYGSNVFIDAKCYATFNNDGNNRIAFRLVDNNIGSDSIALTTDVRTLN